MPSKYFPFDSTFTGVDSNGIPQGDRGASSADWAAYVSRMFTDGYFRLLDGQLEPSISATPMAVDIAAGSAMIKGRQYSQDETVTVSLGLSDSQPRIDRIVLRMSTEVEDRKIYLKVLKGTPAASPVAPELTRTASVFDICLAQVTVGADAIQIVEDNLTDTRDDDALCGYVKLLLDGRYYPDNTLPELLWVYTMYPDTLTSGQKAVIEGDTALMEIYEASNIRQIDVKTIQNKVITGTLSMFFGDGVPDGYVHANGGLLNAETYADLYAVLGEKYASIATLPFTGRFVRIKDTVFLNGGSSFVDFAACDLEGGSLYSYESTINLTQPVSGGYSNPFLFVNDTIYAIGGETLSAGSGTSITACKKAKVLDKNNIGSWSTISTLPAARSGAALVAYNNKYIYCIGGITSHGNMGSYDNSVQTTVYKAEILSDGALSAWTTVTALPEGISHSSAVILGNKLYVFGGVVNYSASCVAAIRVATIDPMSGALSAWSAYTVSLPSNVNTMNAFKFMTEDKLFVVVNSTWYYATISGDGFSTFTAISGWTLNNPNVNYLFYEDGYLYDYYNTSAGVRKYTSGEFGARMSIPYAVRGSFRLPDFRLGSVSFSNTLTPSVVNTGGGLQNQGRPIISPIPCLKY